MEAKLVFEWRLEFDLEHPSAGRLVGVTAVRYATLESETYEVGICAGVSYGIARTSAGRRSGSATSTPRSDTS